MIFILDIKTIDRHASSCIASGAAKNRLICVRHGSTPKYMCDTRGSHILGTCQCHQGVDLRFHILGI